MSPMMFISPRDTTDAFNISHESFISGPLSMANCISLLFSGISTGILDAICTPLNPLTILLHLLTVEAHQTHMRSCTWDYYRTICQGASIFYSFLFSSWIGYQKVRPIVNPYVSGHYHPHLEYISPLYNGNKKWGSLSTPRLPLTNSLNSYIVQVLSTHSRYHVLFATSLSHINTNIITHYCTLLHTLYYEHTCTTQ